MDIAALSAVNAINNVRQEVGVQLAAKVMDVVERQSVDLLKMMDSLNGIGNSIDVRI